MKAAQGGDARILGDVALRDGGGDPPLLEFTRAEMTAKYAAIIAVDLGRDQPDTGQLQRFEYHPIVSVVGSPGSGTMISPRHPCSARISAMISSRKFQASNSTLSGWRVNPSVGAVMRMSVPGV